MAEAITDGFWLSQRTVPRMCHWLILTLTEAQNMATCAGAVAEGFVFRKVERGITTFAFFEAMPLVDARKGRFL